MRPALIAVALLPLASAAQVPQGSSAWRHIPPCDAACRSAGGPGYVSDVWLYRRGNLLCGAVSEVQGFHAEKTPSGNIGGTIQGDSLQLWYTDSFSDERGKAEAVVQGNDLTFKIVHEPTYGHIAFGTGGPFRRYWPSKNERLSWAEEECHTYRGNPDDWLGK
jgi:hypothetical protein